MANEIENTLTPFEKLKPAERIFVQEYIQSYGCGVEAYQKAFPKATYNSAKSNAHKLLTKTYILDAINFLYTKLWRDKDEEFTKSKVYRTIHSIANFDISDVVDLKGGTLTVKDFSEIPNAAIKAIRSIKFKEKPGEFGNEKNLEVTMFDKLKALELLAKIQKMIDKNDDFEGEIIVIPAKRPQKMIEMEQERDRREQEEDRRKEFEEENINDDEEVIVDGSVER